MCVGTAVCFRYCRFRFWVFWFALFGLGVYVFDFVFVVMRFLVLPTVVVGWCRFLVCGVVNFCGGFVW